jgi:hypothetical protein
MQMPMGKPSKPAAAKPAAPAKGAPAKPGSTGKSAAPKK